MICPECNTENRLGAIFCRSCGTKLHIEDVSRENFEEKTGVKLKEGIKVGKLIRNVVILVLVVGLAAAIFLMTRAPDFEKAETSTNALKNFNTKMDQIVRSSAWFKKNDTRYEWSFTEQELNSYIADHFASVKKGPLEFKEINIDLEGGNRARVWFSGELKGVKIVFSASGMVNLKENKLDFQMESAKVGKLPLPGFLAKKVFQNMLSPSGDDQDLLDAVDQLIISDDKIALRISGSREWQPSRRGGRR